MDDIWHQLIGYYQLAGSNAWDTAKVAFQILIILYAIIWLWRRIRATQAERLVKGIRRSSCDDLGGLQCYGFDDHHCCAA